jgi:hypothetical protein
MTGQGHRPSYPTMWCKKCGYALDGLSEPRCPECGRGFDPGNKRTYLIRPYRVGRIFMTAATFSLALAVLTTTLWVRSYYVADYLSRGYWEHWSMSGSTFLDQTFRSRQGLCRFGFSRKPYGSRTFVADFRRFEVPQSRPAKRPTIYVSSSHIIVPHFVIVLLFLMLPLVWLFRYRRARRMRGEG